MKPTTAAFVVLGVALLAVSGVLSIVPLQLTCPGGCGGPVANANFLYTYANLTVTLKDASSCIGTCNHTVLGESVNWGDGTPYSVWHPAAASTALPTGTTFTHHYLAASTYSVTLGLQVCSTATNNLNSCNVSDAVVATNPVIVTNGTGGGGGSGTGQSSLNADFSWTATNRTLLLRDTSAATGPLTVSRIALSWGDGSATPEMNLGFSASHTYLNTGVFTVSETVYWTANNQSTLSTFATQINVTASHGGGGSGGGSSFAFSVLSGATLGAGLGFFVLAVTNPLDPKYRGALFSALLLTGVAAGYIVGKGALL